MDSLKSEIFRLRETQSQMKDDFERRLAELSYECNRRITALTADLDRVVALVQPQLQSAHSAVRLAQVDPTSSAVAAASVWEGEMGALGTDIRDKYLGV